MNQSTSRSRFHPALRRKSRLTAGQVVDATRGVYDAISTTPEMLNENSGLAISVPDTNRQSVNRQLDSTPWPTGWPAESVNTMLWPFWNDANRPVPPHPLDTGERSSTTRVPVTVWVVAVRVVVGGRLV